MCRISNASVAMNHSSLASCPKWSKLAVRKICKVSLSFQTSHLILHCRAKNAYAGTINATHKLCDSVGVTVNIPMAGVATSTSTTTRNEAEVTATGATTTQGGIKPAESNASTRPQSPTSTAQPGSTAVKLQLYNTRVAILVCMVGLSIV